MAFDQTTLSTEARSGFIRIGKGTGTLAVLAQANKTLGALAKHAPELVRHGCGASDVQQLTDVRDALQVEVVGRGAEVSEKRVSRSAVKVALDRASGERDAARTILEAAKTTLLSAGDTAAVNRIEAALKLTSAAPKRDAGLYADQLEHLHTALTDSAVAPAAADRGGPEAAADLAALIATLRSAVQQRKDGRGTPVATERLDLLEGIAVTLSRRAYRAARAAGKRLGMPALAVEFDLTHIRRRARGRTGEAASKVDAPKAEPPKVDAPKAEPLKADAPKAEPLKADAPTASTPVTKAEAAQPA